jgi:hypothetical protein
VHNKIRTYRWVLLKVLENRVDSSAQENLGLSPSENLQDEHPALKI